MSMNSHKKNQIKRVVINHEEEKRVKVYELIPDTCTRKEKLLTTPWLRCRSIYVYQNLHALTQSSNNRL